MTGVQTCALPILGSDFGVSGTAPDFDAIGRALETNFYGAYRLTVAGPRPDFKLPVGTSAPNVPSGSRVPFGSAHVFYAARRPSSSSHSSSPFSI